MVTGAVSLCALLAFSFEASAIRALTFIIQYGAYLVVAVYLLTVAAALVHVWRHGRRPIPLIVLATGVAVLTYVLRDTFDPLPAGPFKVIALAALASALLGVAATFIPGIRWHLLSSSLLRATAWTGGRGSA